MTTETTNKTTLKIRFLKKELKRIAALQRENKYNSRHNQSTLSKCLNGTYTKEQAEKLYKEVPSVTFGFHVWNFGIKKALTSGHILYNDLREVKSHIKNEEEKNVYLEYIEKWVKRIESLTEEELRDD